MTNNICSRCNIEDSTTSNQRRRHGLSQADVQAWARSCQHAPLRPPQPHPSRPQRCLLISKAAQWQPGEWTESKIKEQELFLRLFPAPLRLRHKFTSSTQHQVRFLGLRRRNPWETFEVFSLRFLFLILIILLVLIFQCQLLTFCERFCNSRLEKTNLKRFKSLVHAYFSWL